MELGDAALAAFAAPSIWFLATVGRDGTPQVTPVWADLRDGLILVSSAHGRAKARNMARDPRVGMSWVSPDHPEQNVSIKGRVVEWYDGERSDADLDAFAAKYMGDGAVFPRPPDQRRVSFLIEPLLVHSAPAG